MWSCPERSSVVVTRAVTFVPGACIAWKPEDVMSRRGQVNGGGSHLGGCGVRLFVVNFTGGVPLGRIVALILSLPDGREQVGTGYIIDAHTVLSAAHCTRPEPGPDDRPPIPQSSP